MAASGIATPDANAPASRNQIEHSGIESSKRTSAGIDRTMRSSKNWAGASLFFGSVKSVALNKLPPRLDRIFPADGGPNMRELISEARLRDEISARMNANPTFGAGTFWARPMRCKRVGDGPNWRYSFNPAAVPAGYVQAWERIRPTLESQYDLAD